MIKNVGFIYVRCNDKSLFTFGKTHTHFIPDFVGKLGYYFPRLKGLPYLIGNDIACLRSARYIIKFGIYFLHEKEMRTNYLCDSPICSFNGSCDYLRIL